MRRGAVIRQGVLAAPLRMLDVQNWIMANLALNRFGSSSSGWQDNFAFRILHYMLIRGILGVHQSRVKKPVSALGRHHGH